MSFLLLCFFLGGESHSTEDEGIERDSGDPTESLDVASCSPASSSASTGLANGGNSSSAPGAAVTSLAHVMDVSRLILLFSYFSRMLEE